MAELYHNTLTEVKKSLKEKGDTVSVYPVEDYKNMRLFLADDGKSGFAIKPDGDIVSVFATQDTSGRSHSMLELAIQNGGKKLDNYDIDKLRNIYDNHGFEVSERIPWDDKYWNPSEWNKPEMERIYGSAEPDITYRILEDDNIYNGFNDTDFFTRLWDALR